MENSNINPYNLDWGMTTPDGFNRETQQMLCVFNIDISSDANISRTIVFVVGKVFWLSLHAPALIRQKIVFDLRGQPLDLLNKAHKMKRDILDKTMKVNNSKDIVIEILN